MADDCELQAPDTLAVCRRGETLLLRARGRITAKHCPGLTGAGGCVQKPGIERTFAFLGDCTYFDSTFLGTLLNLRRTCPGSCGRTVSLVNPSPACLEILRQTRTLPLFELVAEHDLPPDLAWQDVRGEGCDRDAFATHVISAHETLAEIPGPLAETFRKVAEAVAAERRAEVSS